jgi:SAM-dependent methyltransferase
MGSLSDPYERFAEIYDQVMGSVDYEGWADYVELLLERFVRSPRSVVDLACGTGSSTLPFARRGYTVAGVDLSVAMLNQARRKAAEDGLDAVFYEGDLCRFELPEKFDLALLFQDGLNYLLSEEQLACGLTRVYAVLNPGSLFIFDLTRPGLRPGAQGGGISWADLDDFTLIWESSYNHGDKLWSVTLTVFQLVEGGLYTKFREKHQEKEHDPELVIELLKKTGFNLLGLYPSFSLEPSEGSDPKLTFVAEKK